METKKTLSKNKNVETGKTPSKQLLKRAIDIKGKKYVLVSDRVLYFNENFPNGSIKTEIIELDHENILIRAVITPDTDKPERFFVGHARETFGLGSINQTSVTENAETSAVGRGLAMMGIGVIDSISSVDEINKAQRITTEKQGSQDGANKVLRQKAQINALLRSLDSQVTQENVRNVVRELTGLDLIESNFGEIIKRLEALRNKK